MLVDGEECFEAIAEAIARARHTIFIAGWDIHSRARLLSGRSLSHLPSEVGPFLSAVVRRRRGLRAFILSWDFAMIYALERQPLPLLHMGWRTHRRVSFRLDGLHPLGACHHQKLIIVDDAVAFCGGLDLTVNRWDTSEHLADHPRRVLPSGQPYGPFHDVEMLVDGPAAASLGELFRWRWRRATGRRLPSAATGVDDPWPDSVRPQLLDTHVAIARTHPAYEIEREVREVERLYLDSIAAARRSLYVENQYVTSVRAQEALARRLAEPDGPEVVIVSPHSLSGWLEESTMGMLRARLVRRLRAADRHGRLRLLHPVVPGCAVPGVNVHSKVMVVDDRALRIGSANLSNRSMGLDTECDLMVEAEGSDSSAAAITEARNRLLAEHLGRTPAELAWEIGRTGSLIQGIEACGGGGRDLRPLPDAGEPVWLEEVLPEDLVDPERPIEPEALVERLIPEAPARRGAMAALVGSGVLLLLALALFGAASKWTFLGSLLDPRPWMGTAVAGASAPTVLLAVVGGYLLAGLLVLPVTLIIVETAVLFGPWWGFLLAWIGAMASAVAFYWLGRLAGRHRVRRLPGYWLDRLGRWVARRGILAIVVARVVPLAPFSVVNVVAGASRVPFRDYVIGTMVGMTPGIALMTALGDQVGRTLRERSLANVALLVLVAATTALAGWAIQRRIMKAQPAAVPSSAARARPVPARRG